MKATIHEIYYSISGEGISVGIPTILLRFAGCSLRCGKMLDKKLWCDTPYALSPFAGEEMSVEEAFERIESLSRRPVQVLFTGGEPLEGKHKFFCTEIAKMIYKKRHNFYYEKPRVETNGKESIAGLDNMVFSIDYKLPGSGMEKHMNPENFHIIRERNEILDEVKFVVRDRADFDRACEVIEEFSLSRNLLFSPVARECSPQELSEWLKESAIPGTRLSLQIHKILWGNKRGV
ncbi:MAG: 4Fe-4S cluster-binding domain-containing protein [Leptospiraceae bacterium]|nr:4Fe-4S cluster-binding domain-containing protein [Leptospiraceae bacterium]MCP5499072.1 4Fe-4S cluster-binding domain-containing protein [Leptospiraceae bacterium]